MHTSWADLRARRDGYGRSGSLRYQRFRQLLHRLLVQAAEACEGGPTVQVLRRLLSVEPVVAGTL
jgi:hypothetical protein